MNNDLKQLYKKLKEEFMQYGEFSGTKSRAFDFVVFCPEKEIFVKILKPIEHQKVEYLISYIKDLAEKRENRRTDYVLIVTDEIGKETTRKTVTIK